MRNYIKLAVYILMLACVQCYTGRSVDIFTDLGGDIHELKGEKLIAGIIDEPKRVELFDSVVVLAAVRAERYLTCISLKTNERV